MNQEQIAPTIDNSGQQDPTTALSTELASLPAIIAENQGLADRATSIIKGRLEQLQPLLIHQMEDAAIKTLDQELNDLQVRCNDSIRVNNQRRSSYTRRFDEVKSIFTAQEASLKSCSKNIEDYRNKLNQELYRREADRRAEQDRIIHKKNAETDYAVQTTNAINGYYMTYLKDSMDMFNQAFYSKSIEEFEHYESLVRAYVPVMQPFPYDVSPNALLDGNEMLHIRSKTESEVLPILGKDFAEKLSAERDRLLALIPSRIAELRRIAEAPEVAQEVVARIEQEGAIRAESLVQEQSSRESAMVATAEVQKLNNILDATVAVPVVQMAKGANIKQKYDLKTHEAFIAVITWWVGKEMALLTLEELSKKFSFMITAANKALNDKKDPVVIEGKGLVVVEDFTTRATRK